MTPVAKYYRHSAESVLGEGVVFMEVIDDEVVRQVEIYGEKLVWCDKSGQSDDRFMLADQPASIIGLKSEDEISAKEFSDIWSRARSQCP